jgi:hypothetical protein
MSFSAGTFCPVHAASAMAAMDAKTSELKRLLSCMEDSRFKNGIEAAAGF